MGVRNIARLADRPGAPVAHRRLGRPGRLRAEPDARPGQVRDRHDHHLGGQPGLAVLHGQQAAVPRPQQHRRDRADRLVRLRQPEEQLAAQHRPGRHPAGPRQHDLVFAGRRRPGLPAPRRRQRHPDLRRTPMPPTPSRTCAAAARPSCPARRTTASWSTPPAAVAWPAYWNDKWFIGDQSNAAEPGGGHGRPGRGAAAGPAAVRRVPAGDHPGRQRRHPAAELDGRQVRPGRRALPARLRRRLLQPARRRRNCSASPTPAGPPRPRRPRRRSRCRTSR